MCGDNQWRTFRLIDQQRKQSHDVTFDWKIKNIQLNTGINGHSTDNIEKNVPP